MGSYFSIKNYYNLLPVKARSQKISNYSLHVSLSLNLGICLNYVRYSVPTRFFNGGGLLKA
mgnify:CR=1 FL=1